MSAVILAAVLAGVSMLLAGPASATLAGTSWTPRAPRAALVLWQAVCLSAGLCLIGAGVLLAVEPLGNNVFSALWKFAVNAAHGDPLAGMTGHGIVFGTLAATSALILFGVLIRSLHLAMRRRRAHRLLVDLLTTTRTGGRVAYPDEDLLIGVRLLDHPSAVAYTVPGWHSRVVLSAGLVDLLDRDQLAAVIDHEKAHVRSRHDLLVLPFQAWATVLGWLPGVRAAGESVAELTEMLADDVACRRAQPAVLAKALAKVALAGGPREGGVGELGGATRAIASGTVSPRVRRLLDPRPLTGAQVSAVYLAATLLLAAPTVPLIIGWGRS